MIDILYRYQPECNFKSMDESMVENGTILCMVCGRNSNTGYHYGVKSCLGCKTFFRRVVLTGKQPKCKFHNRCKLEKGINQKRLCRSCRFMKCKEIGMQEQALHPCRDLIGRRKHSDSSSSASAESPTSSPSSSSFIGKITLEDEALDFLSSVRDLDVEMRGRVSDTFGHPPVDDAEDLYFTPSEHTLYSAIKIDVDTNSALKVELPMVKEFVDRIPGIHLLSQELQRGLLRKFAFKYSILEHGLMTSRIPYATGMWLLPDYKCLVFDFNEVPFPVRMKATHESMQDQTLMEPYFRHLYKDILNPLVRLRPRTEEIAALKMIMFLSRSDIPATPMERHQIDQMRNKVLRGLHTFLRNLGQEDSGERIGELLMLSGLINEASFKLREMIHLLKFFDKVYFDAEIHEYIFSN